MTAIDEIVIRYFTPELADLYEGLADLVRAETDFRVSMVDHSTITLADFDTGYSFVVSLDRFLADKFDVAYMQLSRLFRPDGTIFGRKVIFPTFDATDICVIDTDMVGGTTIRQACHLLNTEKFSVPLVLQPNQDLIDIEDLVYDQSWMEDGSRCSYLLNEDFFTLRTSLPRELYPVVNDLVTKKARCCRAA